MQLTREETSAAFWSGAKKGALRSFGYIAMLAIPIGGLMLAGLLPGISVTVAIISVLSTALTVGMFSGHQALSEYHQLKHNQLYEAHLAMLEGRIPTPATVIDRPVHSPSITTILDNGSRTEKSFAAAEETRAAETQKAPTLH